MKKNKLLVVILIVAVIVIYFIYKGVSLYMYNINNSTSKSYNEFIEGFEVSEVIEIEKKINDDIEYLTFNNIKIRNDFKNFKKLDSPESTEDYVKYVLYDDDDKVVASFWMGKGDTYTKMLKQDVEVYGIKFLNVKKEDRIRFLKNNDIKDDIELFQVLLKNKDNKNNIFTSVSKMKENYSVQLFVSIAIPNSDSITLIDGDYRGYILNLPIGINECSILHNEKRYVFTFINNDYFTSDEIKDLLKTVVIE